MVDLAAKDAPKDAPPLLSCTIITTDAAGTAGRDPRPDAVDHQPRRLGSLARSRCSASTRACCAATAICDRIEIREVSRLVNSIRNNGPELIEPAKPEPEQATLL